MDLDDVNAFPRRYRARLLALGERARDARFGAEAAAFLRKAPKSAGGHRLVNGVFQGGGVLGAAHVGFLAGLEAAGVRLLGVAGASAGSIVALAAACARKGDLSAAVSPRIDGLLRTIPLETFVDGPRPTRRLISAALSGRLRSLSTLGQARNAFAQFSRYQGLCPGVAFEAWLAEAMAAEPFGVATLAELLDALGKVESTARGLGLLTDADPDHAAPKMLALTVSCLEAGVKLDFPEHLDLLRVALDETSPAALVRASMAVPFFFEPARFETSAAWPSFVRSALDGLADEATLAELSEAPSLSMVDGGVFSNLPTDAFEGAIDPETPTLAVSLLAAPKPVSLSRRGTLRDAVEFGAQLLSAARSQRDRDTVIKQRSGGRLKVVAVDTGELNWLNFFLSEREIDDLFDAGLLRAERFLLGDAG